MLDPTKHRLSIMPPQPTQNTYRGYANRKHYQSESVPIGVRWTRDDQKFVEQQAIKLGVTFSEFVRWCTYFCALEVNKLTYLEQFKEVLPEEHPEHKKPEPNYDDYE